MFYNVIAYNTFEVTGSAFSDDELQVGDWVYVDYHDCNGNIQGGTFQITEIL